MDIPHTGLLVFLGAVVAVDAAALMQLMISQPLVAGWLTGMVVGEPGLGLGVGLLLQGVWSKSLPMGGAPLPASGPATVAAVALAANSAGPVYSMGVLSVPGAVPLTISLGVALGVSVLGRTLTPQIHRRRGGLILRAEAAAGEGNPARISLLNLSGVWPTALMGLLLVALGLVLGSAAQRLASGTPVLDGRWVAYPVLGAGVGQSVSLIRRGRSWWVLAGGCLAILILGWM